ncbi:MAG TPA: tryptophan-rich sensory protein, partial [Ruminococcaceae bacterium]|nr:tryptophan-rich sensory protein [Oscillospiraceae bacterium]
ILWALVIAMTVMFYRVSRLAGLLQIPYILWLTFAAYLNLSVYLLN